MSETEAPSKASRYPLLGVLADEMRPYPGRARYALRIALACVIVVIVSMTLRTPLTWIPLYLCFVLSRDTVAETILGAVFVQVLAVFGVGVALLGLHYAAEPPWLRLGLTAVLMTGGLYMDRATIIPLAGPNLALVWGMIFTLPDAVPFAEVWVRFCLWFIPLAFMGASAAVIAALAIPPADPLKRLLKELGERVSYAESILSFRRRPETGPGVPGESPLFRLGMSHLLELVKMIEVQHPGIKRASVDLRGLITLVDRLVVAADSLRVLPAEPLNQEQQARLEGVALACGRLRTALEQRRRPETPLMGDAIEPEGAGSIGSGAVTMLAVFGMERILKTLDLALRIRTLDVAQTIPKPKRKYGVFLPDAFTNPEHILFALKGTLAASLCYILYTATDYYDIHTALITCMVVALSTSGAVIHKMTLRISGACIGGIMACVSVIYLIPHMETLTSLCLLIGLGSFLAAWVAVGSPRISYAGWQIALAFFMTVIQGSGPATDLKVIRDRLIGILLGNVMMGVVFTFVLPQRAGTAMWRSLAESIRSLACLIGIPAKGGGLKAVLQEAEPVRRKFYEEIQKTQQFAEQAVFEPKAALRSGRAARKGVLDLAAEAEALSLLFQSVLLHRDDERMREVPESVRQEVLALHDRFRHALETTARRLDIRPARAGGPRGESQFHLERVETVLREASRTASEQTARQMESRIALYRELARRIDRLSRDARAIAGLAWFRDKPRLSPT